jgi:glycerol-3-phosphate cytidylyltransferase
MLQECKENCDHLIVALNRAENLPAEKNKPIYSIEDRKLIVGACSYVDEVLEYNSEEELAALMASLDLDVRFLGEDYRDRPITGADLNIPIHYINRDHGYSSSSYIEQIRS